MAHPGSRIPSSFIRWSRAAKTFRRPKISEHAAGRLRIYDRQAADIGGQHFAARVIKAVAGEGDKDVLRARLKDGDIVAGVAKRAEHIAARDDAAQVALLVKDDHAFVAGEFRIMLRNALGEFVKAHCGGT